MALTQLQVINAMLASTGMTALTANDSNHPLYKKALAKMQEVDGEFQNIGWWFNTKVVTLAQNGSGEVPFASNAVHVDPVDTTKLYVMRELKLYDLENSTFIINEDVEVRIMYQLPFEELPPMAQTYLKDYARYLYYLDQEGNQPKLGEYKEAAQRSKALLDREHLKNADVNFFRGWHGTWFRTAYHNSQINRTVARQ